MGETTKDGGREKEREEEEKEKDEECRDFGKGVHFAVAVVGAAGAAAAAGDDGGGAGARIDFGIGGVEKMGVPSVD